MTQIVFAALLAAIVALAVLVMRQRLRGRPTPPEMGLDGRVVSPISFDCSCGAVGLSTSQAVGHSTKQSPDHVVRMSSRGDPPSYVGGPS